MKKNKSLSKMKKKEVKHVNVNIFFSKFFCFLFGFILCLFIFFILSGRRNYIKLYYDLKEFIDVYDVIMNDYYGELDKSDLIDGAIDSMLSNIDDEYTTYINENSTDSFLENVNGTYEGIGCVVTNDEDGNIIVVEVIEDSPAFSAGIIKDDIIVEVDKQDFVGKTGTDLSNYIKNSEKKTISLVIKRDDEYIDVNIKRKEIEISTVNSQLLNYDDHFIGYIDIDIFSAVTYDQFEKELKKLEKEDISGLILDVRDNNGGYLSSVSDISSLFLEKGKVIYQLKNEDETIKISDKTKEKRKYPIVVLVNNNSASASEILASAIKESSNGYVVGTNTYGKGTVQKLKELEDGSMIKYTVQKWLTPNGSYIGDIGVTPNLIVELDYELDYDNQLEEAVNLIIK